MAALTLFEKLEQIESRYDELTQQLSSPEVLADSARYQKLARTHGELSEVVEKYREWKQIEKHLRGAQQMLIEAEDAEMKQLAHEEERQLLARKEVVASIQGQKVYSKLKYESGPHRVQRVPATEQQGRIHTSAATVAVLPEADEIDIKIDPKDIRIDTFCSSGPGGQSVNTTYSAVRITHLPTGLVVSQQDEKSQIKNKAKAMRVLRARLYEMEQEKQHQQIAAERRGQIKSGDRSEKIRTYNFPQNRVTDHRIGLTLHQLTDVMDGKLDPFVDALVTHYEAERLKQELVEA